MNGISQAFYLRPRVVIAEPFCRVRRQRRGENSAIAAFCAVRAMAAK